MTDTLIIVPVQALRIKPMPREARTAEEIVEELLRLAIPNGECLECHLRPSIDDRGRKRHWVQVGGRAGEKWRVTRLVLTIKRGPIGFGLLALHTCDNMACINPDHLFPGTNWDNTQDMIAKGRDRLTEPHASKQIANPKQVRQLRNEGLTYVQIANRLGYSASTVYNYCNGPYRDR